MDETKNTSQGALPAKGQPSDGKDGSTSPRLYTESEYAKLRSDILAEAGRKSKLIEDENAALKSENATLKSQLAVNQGLIESNKNQIEKLEKDLEEMAGDDPDRKKAVKMLRDLEAEARQLKAEKANLELEKTAHGERIKKAQKVERDQSIKEVAAEYDGVTEEKLTSLCDKLNISTRDQIVIAAETIGTKKEVDKPAIPPVIADSGRNNGGAEDLSDKSPRELARMGYSRKK